VPLPLLRMRPRCLAASPQPLLCSGATGSCLRSIRCARACRAGVAGAGGTDQRKQAAACAHPVVPARAAQVSQVLAALNQRKDELAIQPSIPAQLPAQARHSTFSPAGGSGWPLEHASMSNVAEHAAMSNVVERVLISCSRAGGPWLPCRSISRGLFVYVRVFAHGSFD